MLGVACTAIAECVAVGGYASTKGESGLILSEHLGRWRAAANPAPLPSDTATSQSASLAAISCTSLGNCEAVGSFQTTGGVARGLLLAEVNGTWTASEATTPHGASGNYYLDGVSCAAPSACVAVGYEITNGHGVIMTESHGTWSAAFATPPSDAVTDVLDTTLNAVSCPKAGDCVAVGSYGDTAGAQGWIESESNGVWGPSVRLRLPTNAKGYAIEGTHWVGFLFGISCISVGNCVSDGQYFTPVSQNLVVVESEGRWSVGVRVPSPSGTIGNNSVATTGMNSIACSSLRECAAVGLYASAGGQQASFISETGGVWTAMRARLPLGAAPAQRTALTSVACSTTTACVAVGDYKSKSGTAYSMVETTASPPGRPTIARVAPFKEGLRIYFSAPRSDGGSAILTYQYSLNDGAWHARSYWRLASPLTVTGLADHQRYVVRIRAVSSVGPGLASNAVGAVTT